MIRHMPNLPLLVVCISSFLDARGAVFQADFTLDNYRKAHPRG